jgi:hypothetical protein
LSFHEVQNAFITKWLSTELSRVGVRLSAVVVPSDLGCVTSDRLSNMQPVAGNLGLTYNGHWIFQPPTAYLGDEQMLQILGRGHSVPTVTELIFVRAQYLILGRGHSVPTVRIDICESTVLNHFAIKAFCSLWNDNWILCGTTTGSSCRSSCRSTKSKMPL